MRVPFCVAEHKLRGLELPDPADLGIDDCLLAATIRGLAGLCDQALCIRGRNGKANRTVSLELQSRQHRRQAAGCGELVRFAQGIEKDFERLPRFTHDSALIAMVPGWITSGHRGTTRRRISNRDFREDCIPVLSR